MHDSKRRSWVRSKTYIVASVATILVLASVLASGTLLAGSSPVAVGVKGKVTGWEKLLPQTYAGAAQAHEPLAVKLTGGRLTPATIVLSPGSRLSFKNADPFPHVLFEVGNDKWAANPTAPGSTREWAGTTPGLHVIRDQ